MPLLPNLISLTIFTPLVGAALLLLVKADEQKRIRQIALGTSLVTFIFSYLIFLGFRPGGGFQFVELAAWIPGYGIDYHVGVDGISLLLVMLTTFLMPVTILSSYEAISGERLKGFMIVMLVMETGIIGVFMALDLFLFYIFWEAMLIPMYLLIGIWGGERRLYASIKFVLYTMLGSLLMLVAIIALYNEGHAQLGHYTTSYIELLQLNLPPEMQTWMFLAFGLSFAIKVPLFPFHTWLPDAHVEAPTAGSVILAGVLLKMGGYGFLRFCLPLFPLATQRFAPLLVTLAVIGIIYGAMLALVQTDMKKLVAYSSVSHLGYVVLGIFALTLTSVTGGLLQMVNHGLSTGALFLLVGMLYERTHTRNISDYGGVAQLLPRLSAVFIIVVLSSIGLPGLNGFVGEFLIIIGSYPTQPVGAVIAALGVILSATYLLWLVHR
ncbi:MAG: NADH-quinone oxidoreductase subunit M, partial [Candidatus Marinimicrobia bacterium]|nr:NADH-quinone oxidoreductase subunit M [Candidatus Neomarinimicrobiota bacterium]